MADVADVAGQAVDLPVLLNRLADLTLEATGADRVSLLLLEADGAALRLWSVTGRQPSAQLWNLAISMPAIPVDRSLRALVDGDATVPIPDAASSPLVPSDWVEAFELHALVAAPLRCGTENLGLLVVDYRYPPDFSPELLRLIGTIASSCALAVAHAVAVAGPEGAQREPPEPARRQPGPVVAALAGRRGRPGGRVDHPGPGRQLPVGPSAR